jgi:hypothetical protein
MTEEPDPMIPVIIGEGLYNLRSALDHLAVPIAPRNRKASAAFRYTLGKRYVALGKGGN